MWEQIGVFHDIMTKFINDKYGHHKWMVAACGYDRCIKDRDPKRIMELDKLSAAIFRDYTDLICIEYNNEAMLAGLGGGKKNVGMEGFCIM